ncbi:MAG: helix-turn-helix transcriptional regulator [Eubacteriales bacterium]|nr:helix-turn-helix transcriptional regulator [Eubacteriales bacterium]
MTQNKSLSTQEVAQILHVSKSTIYELIRRGELSSYKIGRKVRFTQDDVDAYIARSRHEASTRPVQRIDTHSTLLTPPDRGRPEIILAGQDVVLDILAGFLELSDLTAGRSYLSGFEGLLALYQDRVHAAACHLYSPAAGVYNHSFVQHLLPGVPAALVNLSYRMLGFYVPRGNPKNIRGWEDLWRRDVTIVNRRLGSSTRILLDGQLARMGIDSRDVRGYDKIMKSHLTVAAAIAGGEADLALGTQRVAGAMEGIDFVPLQEERYDLVMKKVFLESQPGQRLLAILNDPAFRREIQPFSGNDYRDLGKILMEV